ncbi:MAG: ABC transporter substrate-binding protein [Chloroflexi bacterium]|nr:ABC transporter substrate-binding protein [Chloroflexota bacterium]
MKVRHLVFSLFLALALIFSACTPTAPAPSSDVETGSTQAQEEPAASSPAQITFWHAMSGSREEVINGLAERFNQTQTQYQVIPEYTGSYAETLTKALAAYRSGTPPTIVQVYEVGTRTMLDSGAIIPVHTLNKGEVDWADIVQPIMKYYSVDGQLYCMPFNSSTAMLYYNKDMFVAAGLDPEKPPKTWAEVEEYSMKIMEAGAATGGFSMGWPAWIMEQMFATHNQLFANQDNGRSGLATELYLNSDFGVKVLTEWKRMAEEGVLVYGGREYAANDPFLAKQFPFLFQSTSSLGGILKSAEFEVGTAFLPRFEGYEMGNSVVGGGCLWLMDKATPEQQAGAWEFFKYINSVDETIAWHKGTGYFPATNTAYEKLKSDGWFEEEPNHVTAFDQILSGIDSPAANGVLLGNFVQIRDIVGAAIEESVVNGVDPKTALDKATAEANQVLQDYAALNQ